VRTPRPADLPSPVSDARRGVHAGRRAPASADPQRGPHEGSVLRDGGDLRDMDPAELRPRVGVVFQDCMEYATSGRIPASLTRMSIGP